MKKPAGCQVCHLSIHYSIHVQSSEGFEHRYVSAEAAERRAKRASQPRLCVSCKNGRHDGRRSETGCIELVAPEPNDFVCGCEDCKLNPIPFRLSTQRSDAEGVRQCRF